MFHNRENPISIYVLQQRLPNGGRLGFGSTSLMIYDPDGVKSEGKEPKVFHAKSEE